MSMSKARLGGIKIQKKTHYNVVAPDKSIVASTKTKAQAVKVRKTALGIGKVKVRKTRFKRANPSGVSRKTRQSNLAANMSALMG